MAYINGKEILFSAQVKEAEIPEGYIKPSGTLEITEGGTHDVKNYESAKIVDANLIAENIKKGVVILGVTGTYEAAPAEPTTVTFTIDGTSYTVAEGTTWGEWAATTNGDYRLDEQGPDFAWIMHNGGYVSGTADWDDIVLDSEVIEAGNYMIV